MTEPLHMRVTAIYATWQIQIRNPPTRQDIQQRFGMWWSTGIVFPDRRSATAVARILSLALRENDVPQAPVLTLSPTDASWLLDLAQEETESTECMLLEEKRTVDRSVRLNYEWLVELDSLIPDEGCADPLDLDFGQACAAVDLLHEYLDVDGDDSDTAHAVLLQLRGAGIDISVYYTEDSAHPGYRYELCGDSVGTWYNVYAPSGSFVITASTRQEATRAIARHHGPPVGSQMRLEDQ